MEAHSNYLNPRTQDVVNKARQEHSSPLSSVASSPRSPNAALIQQHSSSSPLSQSQTSPSGGPGQQEPPPPSSPSNNLISSSGNAWNNLMTRVGNKFNLPALKASSPDNNDKENDKSIEEKKENENKSNKDSKLQPINIPQSSQSPISPLSESINSLNSVKDGSISTEKWGALKKHVVKHDSTSIRDALYVGRNEHMSDVDYYVSSPFVSL